MLTNAEVTGASRVPFCLQVIEFVFSLKKAC